MQLTVILLTLATSLAVSAAPVLPINCDVSGLSPIAVDCTLGDAASVNAGVDLGTLPALPDPGKVVGDVKDTVGDGANGHGKRVTVNADIVVPPVVDIGVSLDTGDLPKLGSRATVNVGAQVGSTNVGANLDTGDIAGGVPGVPSLPGLPGLPGLPTGGDGVKLPELPVVGDLPIPPLPLPDLPIDLPGLPIDLPTPALNSGN
ncbi:hypothetical protein FRB99_002729 [Tulasnella sp. 403]|nr:hypothetical protein FRB99_002729 [Tulasnella sp. 403]